MKQTYSGRGSNKNAKEVGRTRDILCDGWSLADTLIRSKRFDEETKALLEELYPFSKRLHGHNHPESLAIKKIDANLY